MSGPPEQGESSLDLNEIAGATIRGWKLVIMWIVIGLAIGAALELFWPRSFEGRASVLLRSANDGGTSFLSKIGVPSEVTTGLLGTAVKSPLETELQLLQSRSLIEEASKLARPPSPRHFASGHPLCAVGDATRIIPGSFKKQRYSLNPAIVTGQYPRSAGAVQLIQRQRRRQASTVKLAGRDDHSARLAPWRICVGDPRS